MNRNKSALRKSAGLAAALLLLVVFLSGCMPPLAVTPGESARVQIRLQTEDGVTFGRTLAPRIEGIAEFRLSFPEGPVPRDPQTSAEGSFDLRIPGGSWRLLAEALDADGNVLLSGEATVDVSADTTEVLLLLSPGATGTGNLDIGLSWPSSFAVSTIDAALYPAGGNRAETVFTISGAGASLSRPDLAAGAYSLAAELFDAGGALIGSVVEIVYVYPGLTTAATISLAEEDLRGAPAAPVNLGVGLSGTTANLNWTDASDNENEYLIERSDDGGISFTEVGRTSFDAESFADTLAPGRRYRYRVRAANDRGNALSSVVEVFPTDIYVSGSRGSNATGDGSAARPVQSINHAISLSVASPEELNIRLAGRTGGGTTYTESVNLPDNTSLLGGYAPDFSTRDISSYFSIIQGDSTTGGTQAVPNATVRSAGTILAEREISGLTIIGGGGSTAAALFLDAGSSPDVRNNVLHGGSSATNTIALAIVGGDPRVVGNALIGGAGTGESIGVRVDTTGTAVGQTVGFSGNLAVGGDFDLDTETVVASDYATAIGALILGGGDARVGFDGNDIRGGEPLFLGVGTITTGIVVHDANEVVLVRSLVSGGIGGGSSYGILVDASRLIAVNNMIHGGDARGAGTRTAFGIQTVNAADVTLVNNSLTAGVSGSDRIELLDLSADPSATARIWNNILGIEESAFLAATQRRSFDDHDGPTVNGIVDARHNVIYFADSSAYDASNPDDLANPGYGVNGNVVIEPALESFSGADGDPLTLEDNIWIPRMAGYESGGVNQGLAAGGLANADVRSVYDTLGLAYEDIAGTPRTATADTGWSIGAFEVEGGGLPGDDGSGLVVRLEPANAETNASDPVADGDDVKRWRDSSGTGFHFVQPSDVTNQPQFRASGAPFLGHPYLDFNQGESDFLENQVSLDLLSDISIGATKVVVFSAPAGSASPHTVISTTTDVDGVFPDQRHATLSGTSAWTSLEARTVAADGADVGPAPDPVLHTFSFPAYDTAVMGGTLVGTTYAPRLNGDAADPAFVSGPYSPVPSSITYERTRIGASALGATASGGFGNVDIAEVLIWSRALSTDELAQVASYVAAKYGVDMAAYPPDP
jgi:hypothetical protein